MNSLSLKQKIIAAILAIGIALIAIFNTGLGGGSPTLPAEPGAVTSEKPSGDINLTSTNPPDIMIKREATILPNQTIELTFNSVLENVPETRITIEPPVDFKTELSSDKKTVKIIPNKPYGLGQGYTLTIKGGTKFEGKKEFGRDESYHISTINYSGV